MIGYIMFSLFILIAILSYSTIKIYNHLVIRDTEIKIQQGQIDTTLQKREDLVSQLKSLTERAYEFEKDTQTTTSRTRNVGKTGVLNATAERYPTLTAIKSNFTFFQEQIASLETLLRQSRVSYNELVGDYQIYVRSFPIMLFAYPLGYNAERYKMFSTIMVNKPEFWNE